MSTSSSAGASASNAAGSRRRADRPPRAWGAVVLFVALITYGSLFPFRFVDPQRLGRHWDDLLTTWQWWTSTGDVLGNVLLFVPLGAVLGWAMGRRGTPWPLWVMAWIATLLFAFALQAAQLYVPQRDPALVDVWWNGWGAALGMMVGRWFSRLRVGLGGGVMSRAEGLPTLLVAALIALEWAPLAPTLDWQNIKEALRPLLLQPQWVPTRTAQSLALVPTLAVLLEAVLPRERSRALLALAALLGVVFGAKLFVVGQYVDAGAVSALVAAGAITHAAFHRRKWLVWFATVAMVGSWAVSGLRPFLFVETAAQAFDWMPFRSMLQGSMLANAWSLVHAVVMAACVMTLVCRAGAPRIVAGAAIVALSLALEVAQIYLPGRSPDITPALLALGVAWLWPVPGSIEPRVGVGRVDT
jgi:VanZ family protein